MLVRKLAGIKSVASVIARQNQAMPLLFVAALHVHFVQLSLRPTILASAGLLRIQGLAWYHWARYALPQVRPQCPAVHTEVPARYNAGKNPKRNISSEPTRN